MVRIRIKTADVEMDAVFNGSKTASSILAALPIKGEVQVWGDEIYFSILLNEGIEEGAVDLVERGDIAYWLPGNAFCIFFGLTPSNKPGDKKIRSYSKVNLIGKLKGDPEKFKKARSGEDIIIEKI